LRAAIVRRIPQGPRRYLKRTVTARRPGAPRPPGGDTGRSDA
jgi:hypothetical protein